MSNRKDFGNSARYPKPKVKVTEEPDRHKEQVYVISLNGTALGQLKYSGYHSEWFWTPTKSKFSNGEIRIDK